MLQPMAKLMSELEFTPRTWSYLLSFPLAAFTEKVCSLSFTTCTYVVVESLQLAK